MASPAQPSPTPSAWSATENVATFIKELVLEPLERGDLPEYQPGDYMQIDIPAYASRSLQNVDVPEPYAAIWQAQRIYDLTAANPYTRPAELFTGHQPGKR